MLQEGSFNCFLCLKFCCLARVTSHASLPPGMQVGRSLQHLSLLGRPSPLSHLPPPPRRLHLLPSPVSCLQPTAYGGDQQMILARREPDQSACNTLPAPHHPHVLWRVGASGLHTATGRVAPPEAGLPAPNEGGEVEPITIFAQLQSQRGMCGKKHVTHSKTCVYFQHVGARCHSTLVPCRKACTVHPIDESCDIT